MRRLKRVAERRIEIDGVASLHGATVAIHPDRNEIVTFAVAAYVTKGDITVTGAEKESLSAFLSQLDQVGAKYELLEDAIRFYADGGLKATSVTTEPHPGFMTDWQAPWAVLMTQALGESMIHETVFSNRFGYVSELRKMGAKIKFFSPEVKDLKDTYNFDPDENENMPHAIVITGPTGLHDAVVTISDLRAGASLVLAALAGNGETVIHGVNLIDRGMRPLRNAYVHSEPI